MLWALAFLVGCERTVQTELPPPPEPVAAPAPATPDYVPGSSYREELASLGQRIDYFEAKSDVDPTGLPTAQAADLLAERARLTLDASDLTRGVDRLQRALGPEPRQPRARASRAGLLTLMGRYDEALAELADLDWQSRKVAAVHLARGDLAAAEPLLEKLTSSRKAEDLRQLALLRRLQGRHDDARALLDQAERRDKGAWNRFGAWAHLERARMAMDEGAWDDAAAHAEAADRAMTGSWRAAVMRAEVHHHRGDHQAALEAAEAALEAGPYPELLDARARALNALGRTDEAKKVAERAAAMWATRIDTFPTQSLGPALEHHLRWGAPDAAVALAERWVAMEPGGDAQLGLARALHRAGRAEEARTVIGGLRASGYRPLATATVAATLDAPQ